jgi:rhodanese-related sulfurtransferase
MKLIRKYIIAAVVGVLVMILVIIRLTEWNRFTRVAGDLNTELSGKTNIISLSNNDGKLPVIDIRKSGAYLAGHPEGAINIPIEDLLSGESRKILNKNKNGMILFSDDYAMLSRAWAILSQMGYKSIYIAGDRIETDELLNYKFRPDPIIKPE